MRYSQEYHIIVHIHLALLWVSFMLEEHFVSLIISALLIIWCLMWFKAIKDKV